MNGECCTYFICSGGREDGDLLFHFILHIHLILSYHVNRRTMRERMAAARMISTLVSSPASRSGQGALQSYNLSNQRAEPEKTHTKWLLMINLNLYQWCQLGTFLEYDMLSPVVHQHAVCVYCNSQILEISTQHFKTVPCSAKQKTRKSLGAQGPLCGPALLASILHFSAPSRPLWILKLSPPPGYVSVGPIIVRIVLVTRLSPVTPNKSAGTAAVAAAWRVFRQETSRSKIMLVKYCQEFAWPTWEC